MSVEFEHTPEEEPDAGSTGSWGALAESINESLEDAAGEASNRAFNLGCLAGVLPAGLVLVIIIFVTGFSLIGAAMVLVLTVMGMMAFANLAAAIARKNTLRRTYHDSLQPQITRELSLAGASQADFDLAAYSTLPAGSPLLQFLTPPVQFTGEGKSGEISSIEDKL